MDKNIRFATLADIDRLLELEALFEESRFYRESFIYLITKSSGHVVIYENSENIVGNAVMTYRRVQGYARLYSIIVDPAYRGRGIARHLLKVCEDLAKQQRCTRLGIEVRQDNNISIHLYTQTGYQIVEQLTDYYGKGLSGWRMIKQLTSE